MAPPAREQIQDQGMRTLQYEQGEAHVRVTELTQASPTPPANNPPSPAPENNPPSPPPIATNQSPPHTQHVTTRPSPPPPPPPPTKPIEKPPSAEDQTEKHASTKDHIERPPAPTTMHIQTTVPQVVRSFEGKTATTEVAHWMAGFQKGKQATKHKGPAKQSSLDLIIGVANIPDLPDCPKTFEFGKPFLPT